MPNHNSQSIDNVDHQKPIHSIEKPIHSSGPSVKIPLSHSLESTTDLTLDNYPYVQLTTLNHEYLYPVIDDCKKNQLDKRNSNVSLKKLDILTTQPIKNSTRRNIRLQCKHCQEYYSEQFNHRGSCEYAPDPLKRGIATVSCLSCAQCMLYHCMSDSEGDFAQNPCR